MENSAYIKSREMARSWLPKTVVGVGRGLQLTVRR